MRFPEVAEQLDTGTVLALKGPADGWAFPQGSAGDYMALTVQALEADSPAERADPARPDPRHQPPRPAERPALPRERFAALRSGSLPLTEAFVKV